MIRVLMMSSLLFGLGAVIFMLTYIFLKRLRKSRVGTMVVIFGVIGFLIPLVLTLTHALGAASDVLWPTSIMLLAGQPDDSLFLRLLVLSMAMLGNVGLYGFGGFLVGGIWEWIRPKQLESQGE